MESQEQRGGAERIGPADGELPDNPHGPSGAPPNLDGLWRVKRTGGLLPPMIGVWKRIDGACGETRVGPLVGWPFGVERCGEGFALVYRPPFSAFVDEVKAGPEGSWVGRSMLGGREFGRFEMRWIGDQR